MKNLMFFALLLVGMTFILKCASKQISATLPAEKMALDTADMPCRISGGVPVTDSAGSKTCHYNW